MSNLLEVIEDRHQRRATIVTSQLPIDHWHEALGEPTVADAIMDRLLDNAHRIELRGDSLRRPTGPGAQPADETSNAAQAADAPENRAATEKRRATKAVAAR